MNNLQENPPCSICRRSIEGTIHPIAHKEFLCQSCFELCGFSVTTPTNCLAKSDIEDLLGLKRLTVEDAVIARDVWENAIGNEYTQSEVENKDQEKAKTDTLMASSALPDYETFIKEKSVNDFVGSLYPQKDESRTDIMSDNLNIKTQQNTDLIVNQYSNGHKISAKTFFDVSSEIIEEENEPESNSKKTILKIAIIVVVSLVTIFVVTQFLPDELFSRNQAGSETISIVQGKKSEYAIKPIVEKDGYIYFLPEGTYKVTMSKESTTPRGIVIVESDKVVPTEDGKGHYESISTIELAIGESGTITVDENQHIYTSIKSIMEFEKGAS